MYVAAQISGFIAFLVSLYAYQKARKKDILLCMIISITGIIVKHLHA